MSLGDGRAWLLAWTCFLPVGLLRAGSLVESDTFWQVRTGLLILEERGLPDSDTFSWTAFGDPWTINSWGFDVVVALAYLVGNLPAVALACAVLVAMAGGAVLLLSRSLGAHPGAAGATLLLASPLLIGWLSARPQLVDYIALPLLVLLLRRIARGTSPGRSVVGVGLLSLGWINLHAVAVLGVALAAATSVLLLSRRRSRAEGWRSLAATGAALGGCLTNPYGWGVFAQSLGVKDASVGVVEEWQPLDPADPTLVVMLLLGAGALLVALRQRDTALVAALAVLGIGGVLAIRILPILVVVALPVLATAASHPALRRYASSRRIVLVPGAVAGMVALLALAAPAVTHLGRPDPARYPVGAVSQLPSGCRLFNSYVIGGYVLLRRPDVPVSVDSRNDLFGAQQVATNERAMRGDQALADDFGGVQCVLVPPDSGLARHLLTDIEWHLSTSEPAAMLFLRR